MGQKVNPHGLRVGVIKDWDSRWYARNEKVGDLVVEDYNLRKYLKKTLYSAGIPKIEIERDNAKVKIYLHCARPGVVIGKGGTEIERLRTEPISEQELSLVKNIMVGEMMRILDGPFGIVDVTIENVQCGTDNHAVERTVEAIRRCTPEDVQRLADKYLRREDLVEVTVG